MEINHTISVKGLGYLFGMLILVMPCSLVSAQGISNSTIDGHSSTAPHWFLKGYPYIHGIGIAPYSSYNPSKGFSEAKALAVEDLNANIMTSAYLESFHVTRQSIQRDFEFAIDSYYDTSSVVSVDSAIVGRFAYYLVRSDSIDQMIPDAVLDAEREFEEWKGEYFNPTKQSGYYITAGYAKDSRYVPYKAWTRAKLDALNKLAYYLSTNIQNRQTSYDEDYYSNYESITYLYSKAIFRRIFTVERTKINGNNVVLLAIPEDYIYKYQ